MALADDIAAYLQHRFIERHRPFGFTVDGTGQLTDWWGNAAGFGFGDLERGDDMTSMAPWLHGSLGEEPVHIPLLNSPTTGPVEVHVRPRAHDYLVVVLSCEEDFDATQVRQQAVNERRLLHAQQQKLIGRQRELIAELTETRTELDHRRREAERANVDKDRFIAMMSHEFRTPLSAIINYADRLREPGAGPDALAECSAAIARASRHLQSMINSVLDEARLASGHERLSAHPFEIRQLVDDLAAIIAPLAGEKALSFSATIANGTPERLVADDGCLRQVLLNLLGNAVKYTDEGRVQLDVSWRDGELHAVVADSGPGIDIADQERLFRAFERGDRHASSTEGSGLGLSISLELARLMGGRLDLSSEPGKGCRVSVCVPAAIPERGDDNAALASPPTDLHARRPARVLVCDDDPDMRALHEYYLGRAGYELIVTADGASAVTLAISEAPDLVVLDINTPGMDGEDAAAALRAGGVSAPIVALTASDIDKLDATLFDARLRKPLAMPALLATLKDLLETVGPSNRTPPRDC